VPGGITALLMGGWFGGVLRGGLGGLSCSHAEIAALGSGLGCAAITAIGPDQDVLSLAVDLSGWFEQESSRQCGVCKNGTKAIHDALDKVVDGDADSKHGENLARWGTTLRGRGACAFLDGAATLARSIATEIAAESGEPQMDGETR
jgi:NADH:ubiquinone oxidoreductase subunit F (NADH-binding)